MFKLELTQDEALNLYLALTSLDEMMKSNWVVKQTIERLEKFIQ